MRQPLDPAEVGARVLDFMVFLFGVFLLCLGVGNLWGGWAVWAAIGLALMLLARTWRNDPHR